MNIKIFMRHYVYVADFGNDDKYYFIKGLDYGEYFHKTENCNIFVHDDDFYEKCENMSRRVCSREEYNIAKKYIYASFDNIKHANLKAYDNFVSDLKYKTASGGPLVKAFRELRTNIKKIDPDFVFNSDSDLPPIRKNTEHGYVYGLEMFDYPGGKFEIDFSNSPYAYSKDLHDEYVYIIKTSSWLKHI